MKTGYSVKFLDKDGCMANLGRFRFMKDAIRRIELLHEVNPNKYYYFEMYELFDGTKHVKHFHVKSYANETTINL